MKISTLVFCMVFTGLSFNASSQFIKGEKLIGGNATIGLTTSKTETRTLRDNKTHSYNIGLSPRFSWVTAPNRMMGVLVGANYQHYKSFQDASNDYSTQDGIAFSAGYFLRNYKSFSQQAGFFIESSINGGYGKNTNKVVYGGNTAKDTSENYSGTFSVTPGFYYRASSRVLFDATVGGFYALYTKNKSGSSTSNHFSIGATFPTNLTLGVQFFLKNNATK